MASEASGFPSLQPAFIIKIKVGEGNPVGDLSTGPQFIHFQTPSGTMKSAPGFEPQIEADIIFGGDWLYFDPDKSRARINFKGLAKTKSDVPFSFYYSGIITIDEAIGKIFAFSPESKTIPFGNSTTLHTFEAGHPDIKFLENNHWVGNGRFILGGEEGIVVESRISKVVPSNAMD